MRTQHLRFSKKTLLVLSVIVATVMFAISSVAATQETNSEEFQLSKKQYEELQKLQSSFSAKSVGEKRCHIEYKNCWIDYEYRCRPNPGGTIHCEIVPVRRCGKPETVCD